MCRLLQMLLELLIIFLHSVDIIQKFLQLLIHHYFQIADFVRRIQCSLKLGCEQLYLVVVHSDVSLMSRGGVYHTLKILKSKSLFSAVDTVVILLALLLCYLTDLSLILVAMNHAEYETYF